MYQLLLTPLLMSLTSFKLTSILIFLLVSGCGSKQSEKIPTVGDTLPELFLEGIGREDAALSTILGKKVIINFWAPWCAPCIEEMPNLNRLYQQLDKEEWHMIGVTTDDRYLAEEFLSRYQIEFDNYFFSNEERLREIMGVRTYPETLLVDNSGTLIGRFIGAAEWDSEEVNIFLHDLFDQSTIHKP